MVARKITMTATSITMPKDEQRCVIWFLTLENVLSSEIHTECAQCTAHRRLSQNQLWTDTCRDSRRVKQQVRATNIEVVDLWKKGPGTVCHRHLQSDRLIQKMPHQMWWFCFKVGYNLESKVFFICGPFVDFLWKMDQRCNIFEVLLVLWPKIIY